MRRVIALLLFAGLVVGIGWFVAGLPGQVAVGFGPYQFSASVPVTLLLAALVFLILYALLRGIGLTIRLPRRLRRARLMRGRRLGDAAITRALVALAAGDGAAARQAAARARSYLGDQPHTLLLAAQAGHLSGREEEATEAFRLLALRDDAAFLGLRGLLRQAMARGDWIEAAELAKRAETVHPGAVWLRQERAQLALRTGAWRDALQLSGPDAGSVFLKPALAAAASEQEPDREEARRLARQAFDNDPTLTAGALAYASRLRESGGDRKALDVLRRAWAANPHPDLAEAYLAGTPDTLARVQAAGKLVKSNPGHLESHFLLARLSLAAGLTGEARRHLDAARDGGTNQRRIWLLLADIAEAEGDTESGRADQRQALRGAAQAGPDPAWRCIECGAPQSAWQPVCPQCHTAGRVAWTVPHADITPPPPVTPPPAQESVML